MTIVCKEEVGIHIVILTSRAVCETLLAVVVAPVVIVIPAVQIVIVGSSSVGFIRLSMITSQRGIGITNFFTQHSKTTQSVQLSTS